VDNIHLFNDLSPLIRRFAPPSPLNGEKGTLICSLGGAPAVASVARQSNPEELIFEAWIATPLALLAVATTTLFLRQFLLVLRIILTVKKDMCIP
jgi:hypothetical protein